MILKEFSFSLHLKVGAGTAGSIVAGKLASKFKVLLLEAGGEPHPFQSIPGLAFGMLTHPSIDWGARTVPQENACLAHKNQVLIVTSTQPSFFSSYRPIPKYYVLLILAKHLVKWEKPWRFQ